MLCFHFFGREVIMGRRWRFWPLTGFLTAAVLGTLAHFAYRWSGGALLAGVFFYWVLKKEDCLVQVNLARRRPLGRWFYPTAKYLYCGVTVLVLILGAVNGGIG